MIALATLYSEASAALDLDWLIPPSDRPKVHWPDDIIPFSVKGYMTSDGRVKSDRYYALPFVTRPQLPYTENKPTDQLPISWDDFVQQTTPSTGPFNMWLESTDPCRVTSRVTLDGGAIRRAITHIQRGDLQHWSVDDLPGATTHRTADKRNNYYTPGFPFGAVDKSTGKTMLYNHYTVVVKFRYSDNHDQTKVILAFEVYPRSIGNATMNTEEDVDERAGPRRCHAELPDLPESDAPLWLDEQAGEAKRQLDVTYTHGIFFREEGAFHYGERWEKFFKYAEASTDHRPLWTAVVIWTVISLGALTFAHKAKSFLQPVSAFEMSRASRRSFGVQEAALGSRRQSEAAQATASLLTTPPTKAFTLLCRAFYLVLDFFNDGLPALLHIVHVEEKYLVPLVAAGLTLPAEIAVLMSFGFPFPLKTTATMLSLTLCLLAAAVAAWVAALAMGRISVVYMSKLQCFQIAFRSAVLVPFTIGLPLLLADAVRDAQHAWPILVSRNDAVSAIVGYAVVSGIGNVFGFCFAYRNRPTNTGRAERDVKAAIHKLAGRSEKVMRISTSSASSRSSLSSAFDAGGPGVGGGVGGGVLQRQMSPRYAFRPLFRAPIVYTALCVAGALFWRHHMAAYRSGVTLHLDGWIAYGRLCAMVAFGESLLLGLALVGMARLIRRSRGGGGGAHSAEDPTALTSIYAAAYTGSGGLLLAVGAWIVQCRYSAQNTAFVVLYATSVAAAHALVSSAVVSVLAAIIWPELEEEDEDDVPFSPPSPSNRRRRD